MNLSTVKVGDRLYVRAHDARDRQRGPRERTVSKVGRAWVTTSEGYRFDIETGREDSRIGGWDEAFVSLADVQEQELRERLATAIRRGIGVTTLHKLPSKTLQQAIDLLELPQ